ncbi:hypothetical protein POSPLADRAFT_1068226 [Postia placenta MAD-698-R-SB12]|uniref:F-box domain-containing protein n=1 Tax=Postia placenta MAD-698-R-SB12 TaxID=670580 RepID=A0A1X6NDR7_9APHY|nr:hypothetical protein POSPLADRAFT_1068226 [Postia placenta MAD-698-R-SB12]OSX66779.1 hypothetical protein POSPLADRAFT_1068226 [Postia placenta MAD-698-R-SB12]
MSFFSGSSVSSFYLRKIKRARAAQEEKIYDDLSIPGSWYPPPPCYLTKLPNDILVDQVFSYLEVIDIIRLRQVCKLFYDLTHHAVLWKRLLRWAGVPVPPLPPTSRHTIPHMSGIEVERLLLRATSLDRVWNSTEQMPANVYDFNAHHQIHSMFILPGGRYLIASTSDKAESRWSIVIYMMDHRVNEVVALAKTFVNTKAIHINARYMTIGGVRSIVIAYVRREFLRHRHRKQGATPIDVSQYSGDHEILDPEFPLKYECNVVSISLEQLEILGDPRVTAGSPEFIKHALSQESPFRLLTQIRSESILAHPALDVIFGSPYLALMKQPDMIMFKNLDGGQASTLIMPTHQIFSERHEIRTMAIRLNPLQGSVVVLRRMITPHPQYHPLTHKQVFPQFAEQYHVIPSQDEPVKAERGAFESVVISDDADVVDVYMTDHGMRTSDDESAISTLYSAEEAKVPRPIVIYWKLRDGAMLKGTMFPRRTVLQLPPTPPGSQGPVHNLVSYSYHVDEIDGVRAFFPGDDLRYQPLVGTMRGILYKVPKDDITDTPPVVTIARHIDPEAYDQHMSQTTTDEDMELILAEIELPTQVDRASIAAMAWDETIGRLVIAQTKFFWVTVLDFAAAPKADKDGSRLPFAPSINNDPSEVLAPLPDSILPPRSALNEYDESEKWQGYNKDFVYRDYKDIGGLLQRAKDWAKEDADNQEPHAVPEDGPSQDVMDDIRDDDSVQGARDNDSVQGVRDNENMATHVDSRNGEHEQDIRDDESILSYV